MTLEDALSRLTFPACLVLDRRARQAVHAVVTLRRAYEHVLVMAALEGAREVPGPHYQAYVDALEIMAARALLVAKAL